MALVPHQSMRPHWPPPVNRGCALSLSFPVSRSRKRVSSWEPSTRLNPDCPSALWTCSVGEQYEAKAWWAAGCV